MLDIHVLRLPALRRPSISVQSTSTTTSIVKNPTHHQCIPQRHQHTPKHAIHPIFHGKKGNHHETHPPAQQCPVVLLCLPCTAPKSFLSARQTCQTQRNTATTHTKHKKLRGTSTRDDACAAFSKPSLARTCMPGAVDPFHCTRFLV
jgi:hypothetical protein